MSSTKPVVDQALLHIPLCTLCLRTDTVEGRSLALLSQVYGFQIKVPPWEERLNAAIYRGSCYATANSSSEASSDYQPRAQLAWWGGVGRGTCPLQTSVTAMHLPGHHLLV